MSEISRVFLAIIFILTLMLSYNIGFIFGMKEIMGIDKKFDDDFKKMVIDLITEKYIRREH